MKYRVLGKTGLRVSEVGFGAWAIGGNAHGNSYGPTDDKQSLAAIGRALELGCNFFDTADVYGHGHGEELLGEALRGHRSEVIIATKVGGDFYHGTPRMNFTSDYLEFALGKSCERLGSDYIDLYQLHNPPIQLVKDGRVFKTLEKLKAAGKIRHYGISIHDPQEGLLAMRDLELGAIQVAFNLLRQEAKNQLFQEATKNNVGIIAREPLANGFLAGKLNAESTFRQGDIRHNFPADKIWNLRVSTTAIELDLFAAPSDLGRTKSLLEGKISKVVTLRSLESRTSTRAEDEALREGIDLFNQERFWEAHEVLEEIWHPATGVDRDTIQGLILTAAALVHYQKDEKSVCVSVLGRAKEKLGTLDQFKGLDIRSLRVSIEQILKDNMPMLLRIQWVKTKTHAPPS